MHRQTLRPSSLRERQQLSKVQGCMPSASQLFSTCRTPHCSIPHILVRPLPSLASVKNLPGRLVWPEWLRVTCQSAPSLLPLPLDCEDAQIRLRKYGPLQLDKAALESQGEALAWPQHEWPHAAQSAAAWPLSREGAARLLCCGI